MTTENDFLIPLYPEALQQVDVAKTRFVLEFTSPCKVQPAVFLGLGRALRLAGRQLIDSCDDVAMQQWKGLFQPPLSQDPIARRKFQKPAPAFVVSMPVMQEERYVVGDQLDLEVLFIGTSVPLIHEFLRSLIHLGHLGLVTGEGCFDVTSVYNNEPDSGENLVWRQNESLETIACSVHSLLWLINRDQINNNVVLEYVTPTRLMVDGKPLRKPGFPQVFPFMLRRVTSMLYAHSGVELLDDPAPMFEQMTKVEEIESKLRWHDWRSLSGTQGLTVGGFLGEMHLRGRALEELFWVLAVGELFGVGKGATHGAGRLAISC